MIIDEKVEQSIVRIALVGAGNVMREQEAIKGWTVIFPGDRPWLSASDWPHDVVISECRTHVRIVAIQALRPKCGAFSRLVDGILLVRKMPLVVSPIGQIMPAILRRWNWRCRVRGDGWDAEEIWRPSRQWIERRASRLRHREIVA